MRNVISKLVVAAALMTASAAPAMACGGLYSSGCSPCSQAYVSSCGVSAGYGYGGSYGYGGGYSYGGVAAYEVLPDPSRYYYVNQGPSFSGPGNYAPYPTYQETALGGYGRANYGQYGGGYRSVGYSYGQPAYRAPVSYGYRPRMRPSYRYGYRMQPRHYGYSQRSYAPLYGYHQQRYTASPRVMYGQRYSAPRHGYSHYNARPQRRMY